MELERRTLLKAGAAATGLTIVGGGALLAASGDSGDETNGGAKAADPGSPATTAKPKRGGTIRAALTGGGSGDTLSPFNAATAVDASRQNNLYDSLVITDPNALPKLALAESIEANADATKWMVRLRKGILFHDGKEMTADDVIYSIRRTLDPKAPGIAANLFAPIDRKRLRRVDKYTVEVNCSTPFSTFVQSLATPQAQYIVPTDFDQKKPIGSGPFKLKSFTPGRESVMVRNDDYWENGKPYADELVITNHADETSQVNALVGGQADVITPLTVDVFEQVKAAGMQLLISPGGGANPFVMHTQAAPFDDNRVRRAFKLIVDRQQMLDLIFDGHGTIGNDVFGLWAPEYDKSLPQREQDIEQAKSLLKAAGHENLTVTLTSAPFAAGVTKMAEVFQQQAKAAGVNVKIDKKTVTGYFGANYLKYPFGQTYWFYDYYFPQISLVLLEKSPFPETHWESKRYNDLYKQAMATVDEQARAEIGHEMQRMDWEEGGYINPFFPPVVDGLAKSLRGAVRSKTGQPVNSWDFKSLWFES